ncbi:MAG: carboxymuconolactone decarboxylase family protein [Flavobacteriaceae bacterium]|nr:carboxymuconolactone decarboxylase family protein [Flavobacteriaceae bacterium]
MKKDIKLPNTISLRREFKRKFSFWELYGSLVYIPRTMAKLIENHKSKLVAPEFVEHLQLAVTEVNGCPACSYQHTKMALRLGMSNEEISSFLSGGNEFINPNEAKAIMFAQHFADSKGFPKKYAYNSIVKEYGEKQAGIIFSAVQIMIAGNMYGIPYSAFQARLKGQAYKDSSLFYELGMLLGGIVLLPIAMVHGILRGLIGLPNKKLDESATDE